MIACEAHAKLSRPGTLAYHHSARLYGILDDLEAFPIIWLSAPAGYGKTSLVAHYTERQGRPCLWYQLDPGDDDIAAFFHHLCEAASLFGSDIGDALPVFRPEHMYSLETYARRFFRALYRLCPGNTLLVLDNYHSLAPESMTHQALHQALATVPAGIRVYVTSRYDPPPVYAHLRASSSLAVVGRQQMCLTEQESLSICRLRPGGQDLPSATLIRLYEKSRGWAAGLVMLFEQVRHAGIEAIEGVDAMKGHGLLFDYFIHEAYRRSHPEIQEVLRATAFLPRFNAGMVASVCNRACPEVEELLEGMCHGNYFLSRHAGASLSYSYHPLFRDFLGALVRRSLDESALRDLRARCVGVLIENGQVEEAAVLLREAEDWPRLGQVIMAHVEAFARAGRNRTLLDWIAWLPGSHVTAQPWLCYWKGALLFPFDSEEGRAWLVRAYELFKHQQELPGRLLAWSGIVESIIYEWGDFKPLDGWIAEFEQMRSGLAAIDDQALQARVDYALFLALMNRQPYHPELPGCLEKVWALALGFPDPVTRLTIASHVMIYLVWWRGELGRADTLLAMIRPVAALADMPPLIRITWNTMEAGYHWMKADNDKALECIDETLALAEKTGVHLWDVLLLCQAVITALSDGNSEQAARYLSRMAEKMECARPLDKAMYYYVAAWLNHAQGDFQNARHAIAMALEMAEMAGCVFFRGIVRSQAGLLRYQDGDRQGGLEEIARARAEGMEMTTETVVCMAAAARAECALLAGDEDGCFAAVSENIAITQPRGMVNHPWWRPEIMSRLLARALAREHEVEWVQAIIRRRKLAPPREECDLEQWPWPVRVYTLGRFELVCEDAPLRMSVKGKRKPMELLKILIALGGEDASAVKIADHLWPDASGEAALDNLKTTVIRLRKLLQDKTAILYADGRLTLNTASVCWVDSLAFERLCDGQAGGAQCWQRAMTLYQGPFLESEEGSWAIPMRERLSARFQRLVLALGADMKGDTAISHFERALRADDGAEIFYRRLMEIYAALGRKQELRRTFERCRKVLQEWHGLMPSAETVAIYQAHGDGRQP